MTLTHHTLRLVLVDDHPLVRAGIRVALRSHFTNARIEEAGDAGEALAKIAAHRPHVALLDVNLPDMNGLDLARRLRKEHRRVRLMVVAAETDPWTVGEALQTGVSAFIAKTNSGNVLPDAIHAVLAGRVFLCRDSAAALQRAEQHALPGKEPPGPAILSSREREVLRYLAHGENTKTIAAILDISPKTVETHRVHILRKLGTNSVVALTRYAIRHGLAHP